MWWRTTLTENRLVFRLNSNLIRVFCELYLSSITLFLLFVVVFFWYRQNWLTRPSPSYYSCNKCHFLLYYINTVFILRSSNWLLSHALYWSNITKCIKAKNSCMRWISKLSSPSPPNSPTWLGYVELGLHKDSCKWMDNCALTPHIWEPVGDGGYHKSHFGKKTKKQTNIED